MRVLRDVLPVQRDEEESLPLMLGNGFGMEQETKRQFTGNLAMIRGRASWMGMQRQGAEGEDPADVASADG
jgi:hypothetical protein